MPTRARPRCVGHFSARPEQVGLTVFVPTAEYMLALKLKALRVSDFDKGSKDLADVANLLRVLDITDVEAAIAILAEYFPNSAADADKQRFVLKHVLSQRKSDAMRPATLAEAIERIIAGEPREKALAEFLDTFYLASTAETAARDCWPIEPPLTGDARLDALAGAIADYLARQYRLPKRAGLGVRAGALPRPALARQRRSTVTRCANTSHCACTRDQHLGGRWPADERRQEVLAVPHREDDRADPDPRAHRNRRARS